MPEAIKRGGSAADSATKSASDPASISAALRAAARWGALGTLVVAALISAFALPKAQPKAQPMAGEDALVFAADRALGEAMRAGDKTAARRLLALQFTSVDADGKTYTRKEVLADLKGLAAPASDVTVRSYGLVAMVTGHHQSARNADVFFLDVWVKQKSAWRALLMQDVPIALEDATVAAPPQATDAQLYDCKNPCLTIPYRVRSPSELEIINTFQAIMKATVAHDAKEWGKHVAEEFVVYGSGRAPTVRSDRVAAIERQKESNAAVTVGEVRTMRLAVYGDGAVMIATDVVPNEARPPYRAVRVWVKRNSQWLMALSADTDIR